VGEFFMKKVGIVGSRRYLNKKKIKEFVFKLMEKFGDDVEIVSGGCKYGADKYAKKFALEFDMKYVEFPPLHEAYNQHCILERDDYGKPYAVWNYFKRNKQIAEYSDYVVAFIPEGIKSNGTMNTVEHATEMNKKVVIIN
jgi:predicted Rossmann fold nucleotide-binding protein DprA/Smf involved in DNA uptake